MSDVNNTIDFEIPKLSSSIIMVTGVGGGGSNAVNHMFELEIADVSFMVCNTDPQALRNSPVPVRVSLGGLGAGNDPEKGRQAAIENLDKILEIYQREGTKMVFITAGMGGGTGTGAAPVIAKAAKELGILTVAIVTIPFKTEGPKRMRQAYQGIDELKGCVDSLLLINNESIQEIFGKLPLTEAFGKADDILATAARGIADVITNENRINVDFADVQTVMTDSGVALMGSGRASGEDRAMKVANMALESPLLNHNDIAGAKNILINITSGDEEITMEETYMITEYIQERAGNNADIIWGAGKDDTLGSEIEVTIIATGFDYDTMNMVSYSPLQDYKDAHRKAEAEQMTSSSADSSEAHESEPSTKESLGQAIERPSATVAQPFKPTASPFARPTATQPTQGFTPRPHTQPSTEPSMAARPAAAAPAPEAVHPRFERPTIEPTPMPRQPKPFVAPVAQPMIERKSNNEEQVNIDELENKPAYARRHVKFVKDTPTKGTRPSRVALKDDTSNNEPDQNNSLFD